MAYSVYTLTNRLNYLQDQVNRIVAGSDTLQEVIDNGDALQGLAPLTDQVITYDGTNVIWDTPTVINPSLQDVINESDLLAGLAPTTNQVIQYDGTEIKWMTPTTINPTLAEVLINGNTVGTNDIDINNQNILNCDNIQLVTINDIPISTFQDTLNQVLINGNSAGSTDLDMNNQNILNCNNIQLVTINDIPVTTFQDTLNQVLINGNTATGETASISLLGEDLSSTLNTSGLTVSSGLNTNTFTTAGLETTADLTFNVGNDLILNGTLTESTAGGYTGEYLKLTINGTVYKVQLLAV